MKSALIAIFLLCHISLYASYDDIRQIENELSGLKAAERIPLLNDLSMEYRAIFPEKCIRYANESQTLNIKYSDGSKKFKKYYAFALMTEAAGYSHAGVPDESFRMLDTALELCSEIGYKEGKAFILRYYGVNYLHLGQLEKAFEYTFKAVEASKAAKYDKGLSLSYRNLGTLYDASGHYEDAIKYLHESIEIYKKLHNKEEIAWQYLMIGDIYKNRGNYKKAVETYLEGINTAKSLEGEKQQAVINWFMGSVNAKWGKYDEALESFEKTLELREKSGDKIATAEILSRIGIILKEKVELKKSLEYQKKALEIYEGMEHKMMISITIDQIADVYNKMGDFDKALDYYEISLLIKKDMNQVMDLAKSYNMIGNVYSQMGEHDKAISYMTKGIELAEKMRMYPLIAQGKFYLGDIYAKAGKFDLAIESLKDALRLGKSGDVGEFIGSTYKKLSDIYGRKKDFKNAYIYQLKSQKIDDSLAIGMYNKNLSDLQLKHEIEKQETEIKSLSQEKESQESIKNLLAAGIILIMILALVMYSLFLLKKKTNRLLGETNAELSFANEKLKEQQNNLLKINRTKDSYLEIINTDLSRAADYVASLIPKPVNNGILKTWYKLIPSEKIGGDSFGYHWIDENNMAFYLLDVSGHGVGAALHSVAVLNVLKFQSLPDTDYKCPEQVLRSLNKTFQMKKHNNIFFTIWYGVYNKKTRELEYSGAGHPPALMIGSNGKPEWLWVRNYAVGGASEFNFKKSKIRIDGGAVLYIFSDGVYEIRKPDGDYWDLEGLRDYLKDNISNNGEEIENLYELGMEMRKSQTLDDDFSMLKVKFI